MTSITDILQHHTLYWKRKEFVYSVILGIFLLALSIGCYQITSNYVNSGDPLSVHDIILDNIPIFDVNFVVNEGVWIYFYSMLLFAFLRPQKIPFTLKSIALFIFIRSIFVSLTHIGAPPEHSFLSTHDWLTTLASGNDLFFSGHTGMPFLLALIFWDFVPARITSLLASVIFGASMLLGHLHYSIDVFSAFFIAYGIFVIAQKIFPQDARMACPDTPPTSSS